MTNYGTDCPKPCPSHFMTTRTKPAAGTALKRYQLVPGGFDPCDHNAIATAKIFCGYDNGVIPPGSPIFVSPHGTYHNRKCRDDFTED